MATTPRITLDRSRLSAMWSELVYQDQQAQEAAAYGTVEVGRQLAVQLADATRRGNLRMLAVALTGETKAPNMVGCTNHLIELLKSGKTTAAVMAELFELYGR